MWKQTFAIAALLLMIAPAAADPVRLATEGAYPPFNYIDDDGAISGFDVELGNELCGRADLDCTWLTNEWDSIVPNLVANDYDAVIADMIPTDERRQSLDFTEPYFPPDPSLYLIKAGRSFEYRSLKGMRIGVEAATPQASWLSDNLGTLDTVSTYGTLDEAVADLKAGNLDLVLGEAQDVGAQAQDSGGVLATGGPDLFIGTGAAIALRKGDTALKSKLDAAIAAVKADGWLDAEIRKYFPQLGSGPFFKPSP